MASSSTASQPSPVIQPLPKLNQKFTPDTRVIHRRFFAEHDEAILLEYAKHYNVDKADSLNKSALVRVLTTHNKYIPLLPHHSVTKIAGREIIFAANSSSDDEDEGSAGKSDNATSDSLGGCHREALPAEEREPANPSWFRGAISSLRGSRQKVFGALMGKKVTKKSSKTLLEEAAPAEYLSDYDSGDDETAATTKAEDHLEASHFSGHAKRPREDEDDGYRQVSDLEDEDRKPLSTTPSRRMAKRRRMVSSQEINAFSASVVAGEEPIPIPHAPKATSSGSTVAQPGAASVASPESSSTFEPEPSASASTSPIAFPTVESTGSSTIGPQGTSAPGPHPSSSSYTTPPPSPSHKRSRVVDDEDTEDEGGSTTPENARKKARRTIDRDASLSALKEAEFPDTYPYPYPYSQHHPMTEEEMQKEVARRLKECFIWVPRDEAADEADSDYVPSGRESSGEESEDEEANKDDSSLPRAHIYMKKHAPKAKNVLGDWLEHWAIREDEEDCYKLNWSCPSDPAPVAEGPSERMATRSTSKGFLLPLKFSPEYFEQFHAYEKANPSAADNYAEFWAKLPPNRRLKRDRKRVEENGNIYTPEETPEYKEHRQHLKDTLRGMGASKSFTAVPDSPPPPKEPSRASEYWNPKYIDIWTGKPKIRTPSVAGPSNAGPSKAGPSKAGRSN